MDFERDIKINETALDVEWLRQPELVAEYGEQVSLLERKVSLKEIYLELINSRLVRQANENPEETLGKGIKVIVDNIRGWVISQKEYRQAQQELVDLEYELASAKNQYKAIEGRKSALENLVKLLGQNYFSSPIVPRDIQTEMQSFKSQRQTNAGVTNKIMKRTNFNLKKDE